MSFDLKTMYCSVLNRFTLSCGLLAAEPDYTYRPSALPASTPQDSFVSQQWALRVINAPDFWGVTVGERLNAGPARQVLVGVIDSGFSTSHPDMQENFDSNGFDFVR